MNAVNARLADLQNKVEEFVTDAARKEAITIKLELDVEEVAPYVPTSDIGLYYVSVKVPGKGEIPVRDSRSPEERQEDPTGVITLETLSPGASDYFETAEEVGRAIMGLWEDIQQQGQQDPKIKEVLSALMSEGQDPQTGLPPGLGIGTVTVERIWKDTAGYTPDEMMRETMYEVASGAGNKIDKATEQQNADYLTQTALPAMHQTGDIPGANAILEIRDEAYDVPDDKRVRFQPPPAPQQQQGAA
jgi:hypothetical protein